MELKSIERRQKRLPDNTFMSNIKWTYLRDHLIQLYKCDPELEVIQVNLVIRNINPTPVNRGILNYNFI